MQVNDPVNNAFLSIIDNILNKGLYRRMFFAGEMGNDFPGSRRLPFHLLVFITKGQHNSPPVSEALLEGDVMYVAQECPTAANWKYNCNRLGIGCNKTVVKMSWNNWTSADEETNRSPLPDLWFHETLEGHHELLKLFEIIGSRQCSGVPCELTKSLIRTTLLKVQELIISKNSEPTNRSYRTGDKIIEYIHEHFHMAISRKTVAATFNLNQDYLTRLLKEQYGIIFSDYLTTLRIEKAIDLLKRSDMSVKEIAVACGYSNDNYFIKAFRSKEGQTPGSYRKNSLQTKVNLERKSSSLN